MVLPWAHCRWTSSHNTQYWWRCQESLRWTIWKLSRIFANTARWTAQRLKIYQIPSANTKRSHLHCRGLGFFISFLATCDLRTHVCFMRLPEGSLVCSTLLKKNNSIKIHWVWLFCSLWNLIRTSHASHPCFHTLCAKFSIHLAEFYSLGTPD